MRSSEAKIVSTPTANIPSNFNMLADNAKPTPLYSHRNLPNSIAIVSNVSVNSAGKHFNVQENVTFDANRLAVGEEIIIYKNLFNISNRTCSILPFTNEPKLTSELAIFKSDNRRCLLHKTLRHRSCLKLTSLTCFQQNEVLQKPIPGLTRFAVKEKNVTRCRPHFKLSQKTGNRPRFNLAQKLIFIFESLLPGNSMLQVSRKYGFHQATVCSWKRRLQKFYDSGNLALPEHQSVPHLMERSSNIQQRIGPHNNFLPATLPLLFERMNKIETHFRYLIRVNVRLIDVVSTTGPAIIKHHLHHLDNEHSFAPRHILSGCTFCRLYKCYIGLYRFLILNPFAPYAETAAHDKLRYVYQHAIQCYRLSLKLIELLQKDNDRLTLLHQRFTSGCVSQQNCKKKPLDLSQPSCT